MQQSDVAEPSSIKRERPNLPRSICFSLNVSANSAKSRSVTRGAFAAQTSRIIVFKYSTSLTAIGNISGGIVSKKSRDCVLFTSSFTSVS